MIAPLLFVLFSLVIIGGAIAVITTRNPVHAVLFLVLVFINAAGIMVIGTAEFLALLLVVVYAGAVAVLFLFVVMMLDLRLAKEKDTPLSGFRRNPALWVIGLCIGMLLAAELVAVALSWDSLSTGMPPRLQTPIPADIPNIEAIGRVLYTDYLIPFQLAGLVLLLAMIAAIVLTLRHRDGVKRQNIAVQNTRSVEGVRLVDLRGKSKQP
ncbi:MAG: NADH-quinone oxidoreductase subunit J [Alphaproteobacteria bacterium]|nr:NADH-quinone oxidoreductase subunit J [Alphaproteobacteria bacterium]